jgi:2'-5' RNA ligase
MPPSYFIGIALPQAIANHISSVQSKYYSEKQLLKPLLPHITIVHPQALHTISPLWLLPKIKALVNDFLPIEISIEGFGLFYKNVFYISVSSKGLMQLQFKLLELLPEDVRSRYYTGVNAYTPHITIVQSKPKYPLNDKQLFNYRNELSDLVGKKFTASSLTKFERTAPAKHKLISI